MLSLFGGCSSQPLLDKLPLGIVGEVVGLKITIIINGIGATMIVTNTNIKIFKNKTKNKCEKLKLMDPKTKINLR